MGIQDFSHHLLPAGVLLAENNWNGIAWTCTRYTYKGYSALIDAPNAGQGQLIFSKSTKTIQCGKERFSHQVVLES